MATWKSAVERSKIGQGHQFSPSNQCVGGDAPIFQGRMEPFPLQKIEPIITFYIKRHGNTEKILTLGHDSDESVIRDYTRFLKHLRCGRVILLTHGFLSGCDKDWLEEMKDALLGVDKQIVALVGWKGGAHVIKYDAMDLFRQPNPYIQAAANCLAVGAWVGKVGKVATWLAKAMGSEKDCLWRIGHSLGAHLMGKAGESAKKLMSTSRPVFDRITGLDPAGPGFQTRLPGYRRICKNDAAMVDIIHTDGRHKDSSVMIPYFGTILPLGTIDFYPNYGFGRRDDTLGNHSLAYELFTWSINNKKRLETCQELRDNPSITILYPIGVKVNACTSTRERSKGAEMGYYTNKGSHRHGNWYMETNSYPPFAPVLKMRRSCLDPRPHVARSRSLERNVLRSGGGCWGTGTFPSHAAPLPDPVEIVKDVLDKINPFKSNSWNLDSTGRGGSCF